MRHIGRIIFIIVAVVILTISLALAGSKFKNIDTAKDRQDNSFGTDPGDDRGRTVFGTNERGESTIKSQSAPKEEPVDWYDKVIITVSPDVSWPSESSSSSTTTSYNNSTDTQTTTTTTQESQ